MADYKSRYQNSRGQQSTITKMSYSRLLDRLQKRISVDGWKRSETIQKR